MLRREHRIKNAIAGLIIVGICSLSFSTAAQHSGPQSKQTTVSDDDVIKLHQQIKELKNPTFRAFLRMRLLSSLSLEPGSLQRQAAIDVATQGVTDLCEHQSEVWTPTAWWLHGKLVQQIKTLQPPEEIALEICVLKTQTDNDATKDFGSGIKMLKSLETSAAGLKLAQAAILSGQVSADTMLGQLAMLKHTNSPQVPELLRTVLALEEKQPGSLPLGRITLFTSLFLEKSVEPETQTRFISVALRASRVSAEKFANPIVRSLVRQLLSGIAGPAKRLAPALYPEIASRLSSINGSALSRTETRLAAEERIQNAGDRLEQLISEANSASDEQLKKHFFFLAARLAKEQGQLIKAADLAMKNVSERHGDKNGTTSNWENNFLLEIVALAVKKKTPHDATHAISKMTMSLGKAKAYRLLGEYYGENNDSVKSKNAFSQSREALSVVNNSVEKVRTSLLLAESVLKHEPADAYEVFRESIRSINNLPSSENDQEKNHHAHLLPVAEDLIRSFRLLATHENQIATSLAAEIKLAELRVSALSGVYTHVRTVDLLIGPGHFAGD